MLPFDDVIMWPYLLRADSLGWWHRPRILVIFGWGYNAHILEIVDSLISSECGKCASVNRVTIGLVNGLSPVRCQAITWTNAGLLPNWTPRNKFQWNFNRNSSIFIQENGFENVVLIIYLPYTGSLDGLVPLLWVNGALQSNWELLGCFLLATAWKYTWKFILKFVFHQKIT